MQLVKAPAGRRKVQVQIDGVTQLRDVGDRLEYIVARYGRLVREVSDGSIPVPDLAGRVDLLNSHLVFVAQRLQEVLILEHESARAETRMARESDVARRTPFPRRVVRATA